MDDGDLRIRCIQCKIALIPLKKNLIAVQYAMEPRLTFYTNETLWKMMTCWRNGWHIFRCDMAILLKYEYGPSEQTIGSHSNYMHTHQTFMIHLYVLIKIVQCIWCSCSRSAFYRCFIWCISVMTIIYGTFVIVCFFVRPSVCLDFIFSVRLLRRYQLP